MSVSLERYTQFVDGVTSNTSKNTQALIDRINELSATDPKVNVSLLLTGAIGLASEAGELDEIVKKVMFQGKPWNEDTKFHLFRELGDIMWYWTVACTAIGVNPNDVIAENVKKLESRYPGGKFDVFYSENRKENDL